MIRDDIAANRLVPVLEELNPADIDELHAVYLGQGGLLPIRIRVFLEFLVSSGSKSARHAIRGTRNTRVSARNQRTRSMTAHSAN
jgi:hypothetical protein